jgi:hypothetical protein
MHWAHVKSNLPPAGIYEKDVLLEDALNTEELLMNVAWMPPELCWGQSEWMNTHGGNSFGIWSVFLLTPLMVPITNQGHCYNWLEETAVEKLSQFSEYSCPMRQHHYIIGFSICNIPLTR